MIIFTRHSLLKLKQREISRMLVRETINAPDVVFKSYANREVAYKKVKRRYLKVVFKKENKNIIIITQHWTKSLH